MARVRKRLLDDYIIPALNSGKYGTKLSWINKESGIFRIFWSHKNAAKWTARDTIVFQDWDRLKGHFKPDVKNYFMCAKQRFRAALYKLRPHVRPLKTSDKLHRDYQLVFDGNKRRSENMVMKAKSKMSKKKSQNAIPTSVICKNTSYIAKPALKDQKPLSPSPGILSPDDHQVIAQYSSSMEKRNRTKMCQQYENRIPEEIPQKGPRELLESSVLRENSSTVRIPHIAPQPVPVYCSYKQFYIRHDNLQECPEVFVSKIYSGPENVPQSRDDTRTSMYTVDGDMCPAILNLSLKSDASSNASSR